MYTSSRRPQGDLYDAEQVKRVLAGSGTDIQTELDSDYMIFCPYHNNTRTPAGEVSKTKGTFFCFSCQTAKTLIDFVMDQTGRTYFEATRFIHTKQKDIPIADVINRELVKKPEFSEFDKTVVDRLHTDLIEKEDGKKYFLGRKIFKDACLKFKLGYSEKQGMVTVPVHSPEGMLIGMVGRSIEGKEFKNTPGMPKSKTLFNLHRVKQSDRIYVVESSFDAIRLDQVGLPAVATLGANVSNTQVELLQKYFNNIIVIADNDEAGGNMKSRIIEKLGSRVSVIKLDKQYKDVGDMDDESLKSLEVRFDNSILAMLQ
jgi:DNA primase